MENVELDELSPNEANVLRALAREGRVLTLIKELAYGDVESLHFPATTVLRDDAPDRDGPPSDQDVLSGLHSLERRGLLRCSLTVHRVSTTEYICEWALVDGVQVILPPDNRGRCAGANRYVLPRVVRVTRRLPGSNDDILRAS